MTGWTPYEGYQPIACKARRRAVSLPRLSTPAARVARRLPPPPPRPDPQAAICVARIPRP